MMDVFTFVKKYSGALIMLSGVVYFAVGAFFTRRTEASLPAAVSVTQFQAREAILEPFAFIMGMGVLIFLFGVFWLLTQGLFFILRRK